MTDAAPAFKRLIDQRLIQLLTFFCLPNRLFLLSIRYLLDKNSNY